LTIGSSAPATLDVAAVRADFPILGSEVHGRPLVYLDNAATAQKPQAVINSLGDFYRSENANIHRGVHDLSQRATTSFDDTRRLVAEFIGAADEREIVFVRGTTEAINLVAHSWGRGNLGQGDEILLTELEHHSNIVPWQLVAEQVGAVIRAVPMSADGDLDLAALRQLLGPRTKIVGVTHVSNALGTVNPVAEIVGLAHAQGIPVLVDGAQAVPHFAVDVQALGCDFYAFSGHKMFGPTGVGVLYGRLDLLEAMPPYQGGGGMIGSVTMEQSTFAPVPTRFEAGTPSIADVVALAPAIRYLADLGYPAIQSWEEQLVATALEMLPSVPGLRVVGDPVQRAGVISFVMDSAHPHDVGTILDQNGIAVRAGHHCCQPAMERLGLPATVRASFALYNTPEEVAALVRGLHRVAEVFG